MIFLIRYSLSYMIVVLCALNTQLLASSNLSLERDDSTAVVSVKQIEGIEWQLQFWGTDEPIDSLLVITLTVKNGMMSGTAACNRYFGEIKNGDTPGELTIERIGATKMMCPPDEMAAEDRYLQILQFARNFGLFYGKLTMAYEQDGMWKTLIFASKAL